MGGLNQVEARPKSMKQKKKVKVKSEERIQPVDSELKTEDNKEKQDDKIEDNKEKQDDKTEDNKEKQDDKTEDNKEKQVDKTEDNKEKQVDKTEDNKEKQVDKTEYDKEKQNDINISNIIENKSSLKTYYEIYDIFKNATYINKDYWTISKIPTKNEDKSENTKATSLTIDIYKGSLVGKIKEIDDDEKEEIENKGSYDTDKYDIIFFLIKYLKYISLINYKLNNRINLNDIEQKFINILLKLDNNNNILLNEVKSESDKKDIKEFYSENFTVPKIFYDDVEKIKKKEIRVMDDQIKFDIYNQMNKNEKKTKYEKELNVAYLYLISQYYNEICLTISLKNDGRDCVEEKVVERNKIKSKKSLLYC
jgi:hypothetical protein